MKSSQDAPSPAPEIAPDTAPTAGPPPTFYLALGTAVLLGSLGTSIANIALPAMTESFNASLESVKMVVVSYLAALTLSGIVAGRLGDRYGTRPALLAGYLIFGAGSLAAAVAPGLIGLSTARFVQGAGAAVLMTLPMALIRTAMPANRIGRAMGLIGTLSAIGTALGPVIGGFVLPVGGWRAIFVLLAALSLPGILLITGLAADPGRAGRRPSSLGDVLVGGLLAKLAVNALVAVIMMATLVVGPYVLQYGLGLDIGTAGIVMAVGPVISMLSGVISGRLVDRFGAGAIALFGLLLLMAGSALLATLPSAFGVAGYVGALLVLTPGYQMFLAANTTEALAMRAGSESGTVAGLLTLSRNLGLMGGAFGMATLFAVASGGGAPHHLAPLPTLAGMRITFLVGAALATIALAITLLARLARRRAVH